MLEKLLTVMRRIRIRALSIFAIQMTEDQQTLNTFYDGFGGDWGWRRFGGGGFGEAKGNHRNGNIQSWHLWSSTCTIPKQTARIDRQLERHPVEQR